MPTGGPIGNAYRAAVLQARGRGHAMGRQAVGNVVRALREAAKRIEGPDETLTPARARVLRDRILGVIQELENVTTDTTRQSVLVTVRDIVDIHRRVNERLMERYVGDAALREALAGRFDHVAVRAVAAIGSRARNAATFRTLVHRHMEDAAADLDRVLVSGIARGVSSARLAKDVQRVLEGDHPDLTDYGLRRTELSGLRTVEADARMIALSETNNAMREANALAMQESPIIVAAKWQTSGNHPVEDECDELATADEHGYGPGFWRVDDWPDAPHPNCGCYAGEVFFRPVEEWGSPKTYD
jgi:hypothetical protein